MVNRSEKQKMFAGEAYWAGDAELVRQRKRAKLLCHRYNQEPVELELEVLAELLGSPTDAHLEPPFFCDYGHHIKLGARVYANHNLVILDCARVTIGDDVAIGPNVVITTAGHPLDARERAKGLEFARPIRIANKVWIGASVSIMPGVEIGENSVIGASSVVTRSIPPNCVAVGNPCRVIKEL